MSKQVVLTNFSFPFHLRNDDFIDESDCGSSAKAGDKCRHDTLPDQQNVNGTHTWEPTQSPSFDPTVSPSSSLIPTIHTSSTSVPSYDPSGNPSTFILLPPSTAPSLSECLLDESGFYGDDRNPDTEITFNFQVRVNRLDITASEMEEDILSNLENAVVAKILPELFHESCVQHTETQVRRRLQQNLSGISAQPPDLVLEGVLCRGTLSNCFVIDSRMTIYSNQENNNTTDTPKLVLEAIEKSMQEGEFNDGKVDDRISAVEYLEDITRFQRAEGGSLRSTGLNTRFPTWGLVMIGFSGLLLLTAALGCVYRRRKYNDDETTLFTKENAQNRGAMRVSYVHDTV